MDKQTICKNKRNAITCASLGVILLLTMFLRLYGIDWGLPTSFHPDYSYHPDEAPLLIWSQWLSQGQLVAKQFIYGGTFYYVILRACIYFGDMFSEAIGGFNALANAILAARYLQVFIASVTILLVYECGRLLYDQKSGLVAALVLALAPAHIVATQTVRPDAISAFFVALIAWMAVKLLRSESPDHRRLLVYTGIVIGATAAFRLPLIGFGIMPLIAFVVARQRTSGDRFRKFLFNWSVLWIILAVILTYIVLSPHTLMYPEAFIAGIKVTASYETTIYPDAVGRGPIIFQYAWRLLHQALGYPAYFLALGGMIYASVRRHVEDMIVLAGIGLYLIMLASVSLTLVRYTLPILPLLALLSGVAVIRIFEQAPYGYARVFVYCVAGFLLAWTLAADLAFLHVTASKNARVHASEWITQNIPQGKSTLLVKQYDGDDFINPIMSPRHNNLSVLVTDGLDSQKIFSEMKIDYVILHELFYADLERHGSRHPRKVAWDFYKAMTGSSFKLVKEIRIPVQFLGIDFSGSFEAADFQVVNPAIRIYQAP